MNILGLSTPCSAEFGNLYEVYFISKTSNHNNASVILMLYGGLFLARLSVSGLISVQLEILTIVFFYLSQSY